MSLALLEEMAYATPVVASDIRGNRVLIDETTGLLYPTGVTAAASGTAAPTAR
jgi:glycosyltransferase involved in cell wall biosynthesis